MLQTTTARSTHDSAAIRVARRAHSSHIDLRQCIRVATWNVLTLNGTSYQTALVQELEKYNIAIAGLTEARSQDSDLSTVDGATFLHFIGHDRTIGVALVLSHLFNDALATWQPTSSWLLSAGLIHHHGHLSVIVGYAPTEEAADADKDAFYNDLASVIESVSTHDNLLMLDDFNTVTGPWSAFYEDVVGPFGVCWPIWCR